ncbi:MAG: glycosyltransferase family 2 protein [Muribaculaceae bacterium]|nr:glycosyltransferase family 2 protein [Muribaculaceae bacterium]
MKRKTVAVVTMVRNDDFFLKKWVEYYGRILGKENLYVYFDGIDQQIPDFCDGVNTELVEKIGSHVVAAEKGRLKFLSRKAAELLNNGYKAVIGVDADEYVVVDPRINIPLPEYILKYSYFDSLSALGLDFGQKIGEEGNLTLDKPFLSQRKYAQIGTRYTKPSILYKPAIWGSGFHRVKGQNFRIGKDLYLLHFGYSDKKIIEDRFKDADRVAQGWEKHIRKRSRTIRLVTQLKARSFEKWTRIARSLEEICRPPYAWNKPGLLGMKIIVEIPERFRNIL